MTLQYDEIKNQSNIKKHKISFQTAIIFFNDPEPDIEYERRNDEDRYRGTFRYNDHYLFIVYTMRNETVRIISVRPATKGEISHYYERE